VAILVTQDKGTDLPLLHDQRALPVTLGQTVVAGHVVGWIAQVAADWKGSTLSPIQEVAVGDTTIDLDITLQSGMHVLVSTLSDATQVVDVVQRIVTSEGKAPQRIDLRVDHWGYVQPAN
jgi:hypothetical protein